MKLRIIGALVVLGLVALLGYLMTDTVKTVTYRHQQAYQTLPQPGSF